MSFMPHKLIYISHYVQKSVMLQSIVCGVLCQLYFGLQGPILNVQAVTQQGNGNV